MKPRVACTRPPELADEKLASSLQLVVDGGIGGFTSQPVLDLCEVGKIPGRQDS
jgi:hypothetical protein